MHHFELLERFLHERHTVKERIHELHQWLLAASEHASLSRPFSLTRSTLDEQIVDFRQFHAQLRTRRYAFDSDLNTSVHLEQLFDADDRTALESIENHFHSLEQAATTYNERINRLSGLLNEFHLEHAHLIDHYSKYLRLYTEHIQQNDDDMNFSALQVLLNSNQTSSNIDHTLYDRLADDLLHTENIADENEIDEFRSQVNEYREQYDKFHQDLRLILQNRRGIYHQYESHRNQIHDWLAATEQFFRQGLTIELAEQLLDEHSRLPIDPLQSLTAQLIQFYSSSNLLNLYEQLKLAKAVNHSDVTRVFQQQTDELIESYLSMRQRLLQYLELLANIQQQTDKYQMDKQNAENVIEKAKDLVTLEENTILPLDNDRIEAILQKYKVNIVRQSNEN